MKGSGVVFIELRNWNDFQITIYTLKNNFLLFMQASPKGTSLQQDGVYLLVLKDLLLAIRCFLSGMQFANPPILTFLC